MLREQRQCTCEFVGKLVEQLGDECGFACAPRRERLGGAKWARNLTSVGQAPAPLGPEITRGEGRMDSLVLASPADIACASRCKLNKFVMAPILRRTATISSSLNCMAAIFSLDALTATSALARAALTASSACSIISFCFSINASVSVTSTCSASLSCKAYITLVRNLKRQ
jgi:hypothetical protein